MSGARRWEDVKAEAHAAHRELDDPARRSAAEAALDASVAGYHLKEFRKALGRTQADLAAALGVSQARISQIENGDLAAMELATLRAYVGALGGHIDVTICVGSHSVKVT